MKCPWTAVIVLLAAAVLSGCADSQTLGRPTITNPGSEAYQQTRAQKYDPYPDPYLGTPVAGTRPQDFQNPPAEVLQGQRRIPDCPGY